MHSNHARVKHKIVFNIIFFFSLLFWFHHPWNVLGVCVAHSAHNMPLPISSCKLLSVHSFTVNLTLIRQVSLNFRSRSSWSKKEGKTLMIILQKQILKASKPLYLFSFPWDIKRELKVSMSHRENLFKARFIINAFNCPCRGGETERKSSSTSFTL